MRGDWLVAAVYGRPYLHLALVGLGGTLSGVHDGVGRLFYLSCKICWTLFTVGLLTLGLLLGGHPSL